MLFSSNTVEHWSCEAPDSNYNAVAVLCQLVHNIGSVAGGVDVNVDSWPLSFVDTDAACQMQMRTQNSSIQCRINHVADVANATGLTGASGSREFFFQPVSSQVIRHNFCKKITRKPS